MNLILKNARVIDPYNHVDDKRDIGIVDNKFVDPSGLSGCTARDIIDLKGCVITPGLIDMHVHFREPGQEYKEDISSGTRTAAAGGFTTVLAMPNTMPAIDSVEKVVDLNTRLKKSSIIETLKCACITKNRIGIELSDIIRIGKDTDIVAFSDDGDCVQDFETMRRAAELMVQLDLPLIDHCEDSVVRSNGVMRQGEISRLLEVPGMPGETESDMVLRDVELSRATGLRVHVQHISFSQSVSYIRQAQRDGLPVTAEVTPHHLVLTDAVVPISGTNSKMNPPLGTDEDRNSLLEALADGTIVVIATDHAPHSPAEKARDFVSAPFGIIGLETAIPICLTEIYRKGILDLPDLISKFTTGPASVLGLRRDGLIYGARADITILDIHDSYAIDINKTLSKSRNSPFHNRWVQGRVLGTIFSGAWVYRDDRIMNY